MEEVDVLEAHDRHNNNGWNSSSFQYFHLEFCSRIRLSLSISRFVVILQ